MLVVSRGANRWNGQLTRGSNACASWGRGKAVKGRTKNLGLLDELDNAKSVKKTDPGRGGPGGS